jgi:hypothetical protein
MRNIIYFELCSTISNSNMCDSLQSENSWNNRGKAADKTLVSFHSVVNQVGSFFCKSGGVLTPALEQRRVWPFKLYEDPLEVAAGVVKEYDRIAHSNSASSSSSNFEFVWNSKSGQHVENLAIYKPHNLRENYAPVSYVAWPRLDELPRDFSTIVLKICTTDAIVIPPIGYKLVFEDDTAPNSKKQLRLWEPICPPDFIALGAVATTSTEVDTDGKAIPPPLDSIYVVHKFFCKPSGLRNMIWNDNSGDINLWGTERGDRFVMKGAEDDIRPNHLAFSLDSNAAVRQKAEGGAVARGSRAELELIPVTAFERSFDPYTDADHDSPDQRTTGTLAVWRPKLKPGQVFFGDISTTGAAPAMSLVARENVDGRQGDFAPPQGFQLVWQGKGRALWLPYAPPGYSYLGCVATDNASMQPEIPALRCVNDRLLNEMNSKNSMRSIVWRETRSEGTPPFACWNIGDSRVGCFMAGQGTDTTAPDAKLGKTFFTNHGPENDGTPFAYLEKEELKTLMIDETLVNITGGKHKGEIGHLLEATDGALVASMGYAVALEKVWKGGKVSKPKANILGKDLTRVDPRSNFERIWTTEGSYSKNKLSIWTPIAPKGCLLLGHCAVPSEQDVVTSAQVVVQDQGRKGGEPLYVHPIAFEKIFVEKFGDKKGSRDDLDEGKKLVVWLPRGPPSYTALGCVVTSEEVPPDPSKFAVVHMRCLESNDASFRLWSNKSSETKVSLSLWNVAVCLLICTSCIHCALAHLIVLSVQVGREQFRGYS